MVSSMRLFANVPPRSNRRQYDKTGRLQRESVGIEDATRDFPVPGIQR
jgi:hypothetical protein